MVGIKKYSGSGQVGAVSLSLFHRPPVVKMIFSRVPDYMHSLIYTKTMHISELEHDCAPYKAILVVGAMNQHLSSPSLFLHHKPSSTLHPTS